MADARVALLGRLIDHAPTFPPASLPAEEALEEDRRARASEHSWMLNRLVWSASRLDALGSELRELSVVADADVPNDPRIGAIELPPNRMRGSAFAVDVFLEIGMDDLEDSLPSVASSGRRAKVRCGGSSVPAVDALARFVRACRDAGVVFKATAGLHAPVRSGEAHGFLNLLAACVFGDEEEALSEEAPAAFRLDADLFGWCDRSAAPAELARIRGELFHSIGSCSFFEPVEALDALGMLPS